MKLIPILLTTLLLSLTACHALTPDLTHEEQTRRDRSTTAPVPEPTQPIEDFLTDYPNLAPLALLSAYVDTDGDIWVDSSDWTSVDPNLFREYMFGTWEGEVWLNSDWCPETRQTIYRDYFVFDDSEKGQPLNLRHAIGYKQHNNTIIFQYSNFQTSAELMWLDMNNPDYLYHQVGTNGYDGYNAGNINIWGDYPVPVLPKVDSHINQPENGFMSRLRLYELMEQYDIDFDMIFDIEYIIYEDELYVAHFTMNGYFNTFPIYLISESPDKLIFKSQIIYFDYTESLIDVTYTIEKINGEWVRTVEYDPKQLQAAHDFIAARREKYDWVRPNG